MNPHFRQRQFPAASPLANALVVIVGTLIIGASVVLGVVAFLALGSIIAVLAAVIGIRVWWLNRRLRRQFARDHAGQVRSATETSVIEGEYRVVSRDRQELDPDQTVVKTNKNS